MESGSAESRFQNLRRFEAADTFSKGYAMIEGVVGSDHTIRSLLNHTTQLVISSLSSEQMLSHNRNFEEDESKIRIRSVTEFRLVDPAVKD